MKIQGRAGSKRTLIKERRVYLGDELYDLICLGDSLKGRWMGSITKPENTVGKILIRRSHKRKAVEQTGADASLCKQSETRHRDECFLVDQSAHKLNVEKTYTDLCTKVQT